MVVRITERRGVGDHDARITAPPERPLVRPTDARNECWKRSAFGRNLRMFAKERDDATEQRPRLNIADEPDEVANFRIKDAQSRRWIALRMRCIGKIANRFEANHRGNFVATRFAATRIDETTHVSAEEIRWLLVHKRDEAQGMLCSFCCKPT